MLLNFILVALIIFSGVSYLYFKTRQFRTTYMLPIRKKMYASLAGTSLGSVLFFFGLNQLVLFDQLLNYIIAAIFILLGLSSLVFNFKAQRHYKQFIDEEAELNR